MESERTDLADELHFDPLVLQLLAGLLEVDVDGAGDRLPIVEEIVGVLPPLLRPDARHLPTVRLIQLNADVRTLTESEETLKIERSSGFLGGFSKTGSCKKLERAFFAFSVKVFR